MDSTSFGDSSRPGNGFHSRSRKGEVVAEVDSPTWVPASIDDVAYDARFLNRAGREKDRSASALNVDETGALKVCFVGATSQNGDEGSRFVSHKRGLCKETSPPEVNSVELNLQKATVVGGESFFMPDTQVSHEELSGGLFEVESAPGELGSNYGLSLQGGSIVVPGESVVTSPTQAHCTHNLFSKGEGLFQDGSHFFKQGYGVGRCICVKEKNALRDAIRRRDRPKHAVRSMSIPMVTAKHRRFLGKRRRIPSRVLFNGKGALQKPLYSSSKE